MSTAVDAFRRISSNPRFNGWPLVGEITRGVEIPRFGYTIDYTLRTPNGLEPYTSIVRDHGWAVVFGVTTDRQVITLVQWKPGLNQASWELPPGGIGPISSDLSQDDLLRKTQEGYLKETGFGGGSWQHLSRLCFESGKFRGAKESDHGSYLNTYLATDLEPVTEARSPNPNEIMQTLMVPLEEFYDVLASGLFVEISAVPCALLALRKLERHGLLR